MPNPQGDGFMDYRIPEMQATNDSVRAQLNLFLRTLEDFKGTYSRLAAAWGGGASENAEEFGKMMHYFGSGTAEVVNKFLRELETHLENSINTERRNSDMFAV
jgi:uncharacterized protein YukE